MKKTLLMLCLIAAMQQVHAQVFVATMTHTGAVVQFKIKPINGSITSKITYFEFNLRFSTAANVTTSNLMPNTTAFPNLNIMEMSEKTFGGFKYKRFLGYAEIPSQTYTQNTEYKVFEVTLSSTVNPLPIQLATNYNSAIGSDYYFAVNDGNGAPLMNEVAVVNNFYPVQNTVGDDRYLSLNNFSTVLPVELLSFSGKNTEGGNLLTWATAQEQNTSHFDIERSTDNRQFEKIGTVKTKGSNSNYQFLDTEANNSIAYYRLKINDFDGKNDYSKVIALQSKGKTKVEVYPTVTTGEVRIVGAKTFQIFNLAGQMVFEKKSFETGTSFIYLNDQAAGTYLVKGVDTEGGVFSQKIVKQ